MINPNVLKLIAGLVAACIWTALVFAGKADPAGLVQILTIALTSLVTHTLTKE